MTDTILPMPQLPPLDERTLPALFERSLARAPDKIAVQDRDRSLTYRQLRDEALALAGGFAGLNVDRQDTVLLMLDNHVDYVAAWVALGLTGRIEVPVNTAYIGTILAHVINNSGARVIVIEAHYLAALTAVADRLDSLATVIVRGDFAPGDVPPGMTALAFADLPDTPVAPAPVAPWDLVAIMYTSGTTGLSKGVRITHAHAYGYAAPEIYGACDADDIALVVLPLFHIGGQWKGVLNALIAGASAVILPRFSATTFWEDVRHYGCSYTLILGVMAEFLLRQDPRPDDRDHKLRRIALVPVVKDLDGFKSRFGITTVSSAYGSTEGTVVLLSPMGGAEPGKIGWVRPDFDARLVDENDIPVPRGSAGELVIRSHEPWVMMNGYHRMPEATEAAWRNLWFHTGDMMRQDERGMFEFIDRSKDAIRRRGENISSFEVEQEIFSHPDVLECAAVAVPSNATEDDILACVTLRAGSALTAPALLAHLRERLPYFMVPRYIRFMKSLPKTPTEKIRKQALRAEGVTTATHDAEKDTA